MEASDFFHAGGFMCKYTKVREEKQALHSVVSICAKGEAVCQAATVSLCSGLPDR